MFSFLTKSLRALNSGTGCCRTTDSAIESTTLQADSSRGGSTRLWRPHGNRRASSWATWSLPPSTAWLFRPIPKQESDLPQLHHSAPLWMKVKSRKYELIIVIFWDWKLLLFTVSSSSNFGSCNCDAHFYWYHNAARRHLRFYYRLSCTQYIPH